MAMAGRNFFNSLGDPYAPSIDEVQALYDTTPTESNGDNRILSATLGESPSVYTRGPSNNFVLDEFLDENIPTDDMAPTTTIPPGVSASTASDGVGHGNTPLGDVAPPTASNGAPNQNIPPANTGPTASDRVGHGNTLPGDSSPTKRKRKLSALEWYTWGQCFASAKSAKAVGLKVDRYTALTCFQKAFEKSKGTGSDIQHMAYKKWNEVAKRLAKYLKKRLPKSRNEITNQGDELVKEIEARREDVEKILAAEANGQTLTPFPITTPTYALGGHIKTMFPNDAHAFGGFKANPPLETDEFEACAVQRWEVGRTFTANNYAKSVAKDMDRKLRRTFTAQTYAESVAKDMDEKLRDKIKEEFAAKDMHEKLRDKKKKEFEAPPLSVNDEIMELFCCKVWGLCHKKTALQGSTEENPNEEWKKYWFRSLRKLPKAMGTALDNWFRTIKKTKRGNCFLQKDLNVCFLMISQVIPSFHRTTSWVYVDLRQRRPTN